MNSLITKISIKRGILSYSSFFLLFLLSCCSNNSYIDVGFKNKLKLENKERIMPITATSLNQFQEYAVKYSHEMAINRFIKGENYTIYIGILTKENIKANTFDLKDSFNNILLLQNLDSSKKYLLKFQDFFYYSTYTEAKNSIFLTVMSKDSTLINKFYVHDFLFKKLH